MHHHKQDKQNYFLNYKHLHLQQITERSKGHRECSMGTKPCLLAALINAAAAVGAGSRRDFALSLSEESRNSVLLSFFICVLIALLLSTSSRKG